MKKNIKEMLKETPYIIFLGILCIGLFWYSKYISNIGGDRGDGAYSTFAGVARVINQEGISLWNPYMWGGMTSVGNAVSEAFYPITYILCKLCYNNSSGVLSYSIIHYSTIIHVFILSFGFYVLARICGLRRSLSFCISVILTFCGCSLRMLNWVYIYSGLVYIPLFIGLSIGAINKPNREKIVLNIINGFVMGMAGLAAISHGILFLILVFVVMYFSYVLINIRDVQNIINYTKSCFITSAIGLFIMSITLLPFIEFIMNSYRSIDGGDAISGIAKMSYDSFIEFSLGTTDLNSINGSYVGWLSLGSFVPILVIISLFCKISQKDLYIFVIGIVIMLIGLFGSIAFIVPKIMYIIPFYNNIREPFLYSFLFVIGASLLVILSLKEIASNGLCKVNNPLIMILIILVLFIDNYYPENKNFSIIVIMTIMIIISLSKKIVENKYYWIILSILMFMSVGLEYIKEYSGIQNNTYSNEEAETYSEEVVENVKKLIPEGIENYDNTYRVVQWTASGNAYPSNIWSILGIKDLTAYMNPMSAKAMNIHTNWNLDKQLTATNTKYLYCTTSETEDFYNWLEGIGLEKKCIIKSVYSSLDRDTLVDDILYENNNRYGIAWCVKNVEFYDDNTLIDELNSRINAAEFDFKSVALLNTDTSEHDYKNEYCDEDKVEIIPKSINANSIMLNIKAEEEAFIVTSELYEDGWILYIDGKKSDMLEVNTAFRGFVISKGTHEIQMVYRPITFIIGSILCLIAIAGSICMIILILKRESIRGK